MNRIANMYVSSVEVLISKQSELIKWENFQLIQPLAFGMPLSNKIYIGDLKFEQFTLARMSHIKSFSIILLYIS